MERNVQERRCHSPSYDDARRNHATRTRPSTRLVLGPPESYELAHATQIFARGTHFIDQRDGVSLVPPRKDDGIRLELTGTRLRLIDPSARLLLSQHYQG
jgi:hypothetical protein